MIIVHNIDAPILCMESRTAQGMIQSLASFNTVMMSCKLQGGYTCGLMEGPL